jgi:uncharacterized small protein (DUF1192 family)
MNNDVMKVIAEQIGALVITNANLVAKISALEAELEKLKQELLAKEGG